MFKAVTHNFCLSITISKSENYIIKIKYKEIENILLLNL